MPFKIVQTSENNTNRLFTVPSAWEDKNILKWPRKHVTKYIKDEFSTPDVDWKQLICLVKRQDIPSYETAEYVLTEMLYHTDTEDDTISNCKTSGNPVPELNLNIIADEIVYPANMTAVTESSEITTDTCTIPAVPSIGLNSDDVYQFHIVSDTQNKNNQHECCANLEKSLAMQNVLLSNQCKILEQLNTITNVQNSLIQKVASFSVQLEDAILQINQATGKDFHVTELSEARSTTSNTSFYIKPVDSIQKLNELEQQLSESSVRQQLKNRYSVICSGGKGIDCAYTLVDILFSRNLLCQCTWSGGSRKEDIKFAFKSYKNILSFFWQLIHSWNETYTINDNESFFKNILKNSKKRQMAKNQRASTSRKRVRLSKAQIVNEEDNNEKNPITVESEEDQCIETENEKIDDGNKSNKKEETKNIDEETKGDKAINEKKTEEECVVREMEKEQNSLEEITMDLNKIKEHGIVYNLKGKEQTNLEFTRHSEKETITEANKENIIEVRKMYEPSTSSVNSFLKNSSNPKMKITQILKKKRQDKRLENLKNIRRIHKKVSFRR